MLVRTLAAVGIAFGSFGAAFGATRWLKAEHRYEMAASANGVIWRMDRETGQLSTCFSSGIGSEPVCGPWGSRPYQLYMATDGRPLSSGDVERMEQKALEELYAKGVLSEPK